MVKSTFNIATPFVKHPLTEYEQPLNERMRTFLRLEFLYQQMLYYSELEANWATRSATSSLLEIMSILMRGDVCSEVHKELSYQIKNLEQFVSQPSVDSKRLNALLESLLESLNEINSIGTRFMQPLKDCEFLSSIKQRSSIPGGTCEFDLPEYNHWLRQPFARRQQDLQGWLNVIRPVCDTVIELLWLIRESVQPVEKTAINGMYQHNIQKRTKRRLLRVTLPINSQLYPEISASQHRFTVRFLEWSNIGHRAIQTEHDVQFQVSTC
jgi:cell division protein ZapD